MFMKCQTLKLMHKNFDLRIDEYFRLAEGVPQKRLERIVENLVAEKKMLVDGSVLKPY